MVEEARLAEVGSGLAPVTEGWFVVKVVDAAWIVNDAFGSACPFEANVPVLRERSDLPVHKLADLGFKDFLVLAGECLLIVEGEERRLEAWDFVHCPPGTEHVFVGAGDGPCAIFMTGGQTREKTIVYPSSEPARRHRAGVETETSSASEAYSQFPHWQPGRPENWRGLPWA
jgi:mannose-6-phosphate isomerase-like protein (cupin superfamily)